MSAAERHLRQDQDLRSDPSQGLSKHRSEAQLSLSEMSTLTLFHRVSQTDVLVHLLLHSLHVVLTFLQTFLVFL